MNTSCLPRTANLCRSCRIHVSWPVTGVDGTTQVAASLEGGPWVPLAVAPDYRSVIGYFAGPAFQTPGAATVVPATSHVRIQVTTPTEVLEFDGGFIALRP